MAMKLACVWGNWGGLSGCTPPLVVAGGLVEELGGRHGSDGEQALKGGGGEAESMPRELDAVDVDDGDEEAGLANAPELEDVLDVFGWGHGEGRAFEACKRLLLRVYHVETMLTYSNN
jgi:hypothetical protein